jgi:hypothetical protein
VDIIARLLEFFPLCRSAAGRQSLPLSRRLDGLHRRGAAIACPITNATIANATIIAAKWRRNTGQTDRGQHHIVSARNLTRRDKLNDGR